MSEIALNSLGELAEQINDAHEQCNTAFKHTLNHALFAGEKLLEAKEICGHGNWLNWCNENIKHSQSTSKRYMSLALNKKLIIANRPKMGDLSMDGALKILKEGEGNEEWWQTSNKHDWETPQWLFDILNDEFNFTLDVCADENSAKCQNYFDESDDGLQQKWSGTCWMNPPYGRAIKDWMAKARSEADNGAIVVCLVPARTDPEWMWNYCRRSELRLLPGRLRFSQAGPATFPSMIVIMRKTDNKYSDLFWDVRAPDGVD